MKRVPWTISENAALAEMYQQDDKALRPLWQLAEELNRRFHDGEPIRTAASTGRNPNSGGKREPNYNLCRTKIKVTLMLDDWKLLIAYFEGNVEAMGDTAPELQPEARRIQTTMRKAVTLAELKMKK